MKAVVHQSSKDNQWYAEFKGDNNETWFVSEGYTTDDSAVRSIEDFHARMSAVIALEIDVYDARGVKIRTELIIGGM